MSDILLVEDSEAMAVAYMGYLRKGGFDARHVMTGVAALQAIEERMPRAVVLDVQLPDGSGIDFLQKIQSRAPNVVVIMITAHGNVEIAVEAMRHGAHDFIMKPFTADRLNLTLKNALEKKSLENELAERMAEEGDGFGPFVGRSAPMQAVYRTLRHVASSKVPVFITGESGTGKELAAEALHQLSPRRSAPFKAINCGAIPENLIEAELFGHTKGAFTGAVSDRMGAVQDANGGTLFLDEICEMPLELQVKLLRVLQTSVVQPVGSNKEIKVDVRVLAATNRDPLAEVKAGRFREDLYYRLFVVPLELPPLRARGEDIMLLATFFLQRGGKEEGKTFAGFAADATNLLQNHSWPGNVRQLENAIRYVAATKQGGIVQKSDLPPHILDESSTVVKLEAFKQDNSIVPLAQMEQQAIRAALQAAGDDVTRAAAMLQINPSTIYRKLQAWEKEANHS